MIIVRTILAVLGGYLVYAFGSMLLVGPVMTTRSIAIAVVALVALALIGIVAGVVVRAIADKGTRIAGSIVGALIALATLANLIMGFGAEPVWYKLGTLLLTVPAVLILSLRRSRR